MNRIKVLSNANGERETLPAECWLLFKMDRNCQINWTT